MSSYGMAQEVTSPAEPIEWATTTAVRPTRRPGRSAARRDAGVQSALESKSCRADATQARHLAGEMRLVRVAAESGGNAERRGARYEPPKPHDPLVFFRAKSAVMDQEAAKVSPRQAHRIGRLVNGPVAQELDGPRDLTGGRVQEQRIRLPSED